MEKQKKKLSKKAVVICSIVLVVLVVGGVIGMLVHKNTRPTDPDKIYTFDEVTMGLSTKVSYVVDSDSVLTQKEIDELYRYSRETYYHYSDINKTKIVSSGSISFEAPEEMNHLLYYDENNNRLFDIIEHRYGIYCIGINGEYIFYQIRSPLKADYKYEENNES